MPHPNNKLSTLDRLQTLDEDQMADLRDSIARSVCWAMLGGVDKPERLLTQFKRVSDRLDQLAAERVLEQTASL